MIPPPPILHIDIDIAQYTFLLYASTFVETMQHRGISQSVYTSSYYTTAVRIHL